LGYFIEGFKYGSFCKALMPLVPKSSYLLTQSSQSKKTLREAALETNEANPSQLGDPVSLKAETSSNSPTSQDRGASSSPCNSEINKIAPAPTKGNRGGDRKGGIDGHKTLRQRAMEKLDENPSQLGDPVSLKVETAESEPTDNDRGAAGKAGKSKL
jgi:hypothetical protein